VDRSDRSVSRGFDDDKVEFDVDFDVVLPRMGISGKGMESKVEPQISYPRSISMQSQPQLSILYLPALPRSTFNPAFPAPLASPASSLASPWGAHTLSLLRPANNPGIRSS
jgi:hypothetical protein